MPDDHPQRLRALEERIAGIAQRVSDMETTLSQVMPIREAQIRLEGKLEAARDDVQECANRVAEIRRKMDAEREEREQRWREERRDSQRNKVALYIGLSVAFLGAVGSLVVQLVVAGHTP